MTYKPECQFFTIEAGGETKVGFQARGHLFGEVDFGMEEVIFWEESDYKNLRPLTIATIDDTVIPDFNPRQFLLLMRLHALDRQEKWKPIVEAVEKQAGSMLLRPEELVIFGIVGNDKTGCELCGYFNHQKSKCNCDCNHSVATPECNRLVTSISSDPILRELVEETIAKSHRLWRSIPETAVLVLKAIEDYGVGK